MEISPANVRILSQFKMSGIYWIKVCFIFNISKIINRLILDFFNFEQ